MFESVCQDQFLGTFQMCQRKTHCLISLCLVPIFNLLSNPLLHSIFHEMVIYFLSHLLLLFFPPWNVCFGSYLRQFQSAVLFCSQSVFILCWVTGGSCWVAGEKCFRNQAHLCVPKLRHCLCLLSCSSPNSWCCLACSPWDLELCVRHTITFIVRI